MLAGVVALVWAASGAASDATLKSEFVWALSVLTGIAAMTGLHIRGFAGGLRRELPLHKAVSDLRLLLLYTGAAWGMGAFLVMPDQPAPALAFGFAGDPSLALALLLRRRARRRNVHRMPVILAAASAASLGTSPSGPPGSPRLLCAAGLLIFCLPHAAKREIVGAPRFELPGQPERV